MTYAEKNGLALETAYPYTAKNGVCKDTSVANKVKVTKIASVGAKSVAQLKAAIAQGPTSVTVEADRSVFQLYKSGVLNSTACGTQLDHAITAVGYGTDPTAGEYYIVRNSWGASWGDQGYIMIAAVDGVGICGIQQISVWPNTN